MKKEEKEEVEERSINFKKTKIITKKKEVKAKEVEKEVCEAPIRLSRKILFTRVRQFGHLKRSVLNSMAETICRP